MRISCLNTRLEIEKDSLESRAVVVIDVLRATTVMVTAFENGARAIHPVETIEEAHQLKAKGLATLLCGERHAVPIEGFDLTNSPLAYTKNYVAGKTLAMTTTNGTQTIKACEEASEIYIGSYHNAEALATQLVALGRDVVIVCSGTYKEASTDDIVCAGKLIHQLKQKTEVSLADMAFIAEHLYLSFEPTLHASLEAAASHYKRLMDKGMEEDVAFCFSDCTTSVVPIYRDGVIRVEEALHENRIVAE